jgi:hypothetical protein
MGSPACQRRSRVGVSRARAVSLRTVNSGSASRRDFFRPDGPFSLATPGARGLYAFTF